MTDRVQLRRLFRVVNGGTPAARLANWGGDIQWLTPEDMGLAADRDLASGRRTLTALGQRSAAPLVPPGSLLLSTRAPIGHIGIVGRPMSFNQGCRALVPRVPVDTRFFYWQLLALRDELKATGQGSTFAELSGASLAAFRVRAPDVVEQRRIADFLDAETTRIDAMGGLRIRQGRLLAERLVATENLELNLGPMRGWASRRLSQLCDQSRPVQYGIVLPGPDVEDGVLLVKGGDVKPERLAPARLSRTSREIESGYARSRLGKRDLVFAIRGGVGDVELVPDSLAGANITQDVARIAPLPDVDEVWLLHALRSPLVQSQAAAMVTGATIKGINIGDLRRLVISVPPIEVQRQVGAKVAARSAAYALLFETIDRQIALLHERRQALITAAVTGRLLVPADAPADAAA